MSGRSERNHSLLALKERWRENPDFDFPGIYITAEGSFQDRDRVGTWAVILSFPTEDGRLHLEIARGRMETGATSIKAEIMGIKQGIRRLPHPLPKGTFLMIRTDLNVAFKAIQMALHLDRPDWWNGISHIQDIKELREIGDAALELRKAGYVPSVQKILQQDKPLEYRMAHKAAKQLHGEEGLRLLQEERGIWGDSPTRPTSSSEFNI